MMTLTIDVTASPVSSVTEICEDAVKLADLLNQCLNLKYGEHSFLVQPQDDAWVLGNAMMEAKP